MVVYIFIFEIVIKDFLMKCFFFNLIILLKILSFVIDDYGRIKNF